MLEHRECRECGEVFDEELFATDPRETIVCPLCGTVALDAEPVEDHVLHIGGPHARAGAAAPARLGGAEPGRPLLRG